MNNLWNFYSGGQSKPPKKPLFRCFIWQFLVALAVFAALFYGTTQEGSFADFTHNAIALIQGEKTSQAVPASNDVSTDVSLLATKGPNMVLPLSGSVVRQYLAVEKEGEVPYEGILICGQAEDKVQAAAAGKVTVAEENAEGWEIEINHGSEWVTRYENLAEANVEPDDEVRQGATVGKVGEADIGFCIYYQGKSIDPLAYLSWDENQ